ncbi:MAG: nucleoside triphosphate pyrophosphohydrolase [Desulfovibrionaceae bacterium]
MENTALTKLQSIIDRLIGPDGCPWDKEQSPESLADYVIEESHELVEAIRSGHVQDVRSELGDVAFLLLFIARLYEKKHAFNWEDALSDNAEKMIRRHPHVFGDAHFENKEEQLRAWESIKRAEKKTTEANDDSTDTPPTSAAGIFDSLPKGLPPLIKAYRIHSKAARVGFTWPEDQDVEQQVEAEWLEWLDVAATDNKAAQQHELGDMLFTLVELGRRKGLKANEALDYATMRFLDRFARMEALARERKLDFPNLSLDDKDDLWNEVKAAEVKPA